MAEHQRPGGGGTHEIAGIAGGGREEDRDRGPETPIRRRRRGAADDPPMDAGREAGVPEGSELTPADTNVLGGSERREREETD